MGRRVVPDARTRGHALARVCPCVRDQYATAGERSGCYRSPTWYTRPRRGVDRIDWVRLGHEYGRLLPALHVLHDLVPWSPHAAEGVAPTAEAAARRGPCPADPFGSALVGRGHR